MVYKMLQVSEKLEGMTNLNNLIEASEVKFKSNSFQEWIFGQANWACLSYWDL